MFLLILDLECCLRQLVLYQGLMLLAQGKKGEPGTIQQWGKVGKRVVA